MKILRKIFERFLKTKPEEIICYQHGRWVRILKNGQLVYEGPIEFMSEEAKQAYERYDGHVSWIHGKGS